MPFVRRVPNSDPPRWRVINEPQDGFSRPQMRRLMEEIDEEVFPGRSRTLVSAHVTRSGPGALGVTYEDVISPASRDDRDDLDQRDPADREEVRVIERPDGFDIVGISRAVVDEFISTSMKARP